MFEEEFNQIPSEWLLFLNISYSLKNNAWLDEYGKIHWNFQH
jgi:hypothetical protein